MWRGLVVASALMLAVACAGDPAPTITSEAVDTSGTVGRSEPTVPGATGAAATPATLERPDPSATAAAIEYGDRWPEVIAVDVARAGEGAWRFNVTLSSPYDTPERYADAWRVLDTADVELGIRVLAHDHATEQPFTRSHVIDVPAGVTTVLVEGRDQANGWSGQRFEVVLPQG